MIEAKKNKVFVLSKKENILNKYPEYKDQEVYYFTDEYSLMDLMSFKPDFIIVPNKDEVINVRGV